MIMSQLMPSEILSLALDQDTMELVNRRRRQLHLHSIIYYHLNLSVISDAVFDEWSNELFLLQEHCPELCDTGYLWEHFGDWTGDTGMHLPVTPSLWLTALSLVGDYEKRIYDVA